MAYFWLKAINQLLNLLIPITKLKLFTMPLHLIQKC